MTRYGKRNRSLRFNCTKCSKYFSVKTTWINTKAILSDHLDGLSFRDLSRRYDMSPMKAWRICEDELKKLPNNNQFTFNYCNRFSSTFVCDGKYFNVVNGNDNSDWVLLWGMDYFYHDIPIILVAPSESYDAWAKFFSFFRIISHHPQLVVCDDNNNLKMAARAKLLQVKIQTCYNHFKENIRRELKVRSDDTYKTFMHRIEKVLNSSNKLSDETFNHWMWCLVRDYAQDPVCLTVLTNIEKYKKELLAYRGIPQSPLTTNLVEGMNNHLEQRLTSICSFQSVQYAKLWFNGYILKRRMTTFTDCRAPFRYMNGKTGVELTQKPGLVLPILF